MNYAEDRLDRRAREAGSTNDQLASDQRRAHDVIRRHSQLDFAGAVADAPTVQSLRELRAAHELAGRALRDGGCNREATFHFGVAWKMCHWLEHNDCNCIDDSTDEAENEWRACGDYAQMCELSGFPEVAILALLFYRAGGRLELQSMMFHREEDGGAQGGCGCGYTECGASPCFVAFPCHSPIMQNILHALDALAVDANESFPTASEILAHLAQMARKADFIGDPIRAMYTFLEERQVMAGVPPILRYWDDESTEAVSGDEGHLSATTNRQIQHQPLPPVILLLLLKLLYSSPIAGPFLQLACISLPYLAAMFHPVSSQGRDLARDYKSHWAYYVFVKSLVLGERVKKHKQGKGIHHTPVWDLVFGQIGETKATWEEKKEEFNRGGTSVYCRRILEACSTESNQSTSECKTPGVDAYQEQRPSIPPISPQRLSSYSMHPPIFVVGDSHVLSLAWQCIRLQRDQSTIHRTLVPFPSTGIKAWHTRPSTRFFTHYNLHLCLGRLPPTHHPRSVILSAGEIDCREGIGGTLLEGYYRNCGDAVERTVVEYLAALTGLAKEYNLKNVLVLPVAPHAYRSEKNGKSLGRAKRRETMSLWNEVLRRELGSASPQNNVRKYDRVFLLDYEKRLQHPDAKSPVGYVLHPSYNADFTHVNSAVVPLVEAAILQCGCKLESL